MNGLHLLVWLIGLGLVGWYWLHTEPAPDGPTPRPCRACNGLGEVQVGWEWDTNAAITRTCNRCHGTGERR